MKGTLEEDLSKEQERGNQKKSSFLHHAFKPYSSLISSRNEDNTDVCLSLTLITA